VSMIVWGLKPSIDFTGGSILEVSYDESPRPEVSEIISALSTFDLQESIRPTGEKGFIIRMRSINPEEKSMATKALSGLITSTSTALTEVRFDSIGPVLGREAVRSSVVSITLVIIAIVLFITYVFRKVSEPVKSWKYGLIAIVALVHDIIIPTGVFSVLGHFAGYEVDTLFVTAILVILGFSIHDTIVVFDRVRENLKNDAENKIKKPFDIIVGESINQTLVRSINTSLTTLIALVVLWIVGGEATRNFALVLIIGITAGTYSSVFIGSPLLVTVERLKKFTKKK
jgi:preprotein translocase subunit SecF